MGHGALYWELSTLIIYAASRTRCSIVNVGGVSEGVDMIIW